MQPPLPARLIPSRVAWLRVHPLCSTESDVKHAHREIMNHQRLLHPHVVQLKEVRLDQHNSQRLQRRFAVGWRGAQLLQRWFTVGWRGCRPWSG